ncbi:Hypothetical predicted protein [Mytilus galloprovincialis]|uniref:Uncharacterized protein n=1 Tax=Mytilus galloprovincialis TaxID=29158 RepID=A0A8B6C7J5_MYTGA|nr:Hypothetical predicted protein [Mytilus galloprovincialis]
MIKENQYKSCQSSHFDLEHAVLYGDLEKVRFCLDKGADVNYSQSIWFEDETPLHLAVRYKYPKIVQLLLERDDLHLNKGNKFGDETPLHLAVRFKNPEIVQLFLEREDLDPNKGNKDCDTPLHLAIKGESQEIVKLLLERTDIDPNKVNKTEVNITFITMSSLVPTNKPGVGSRTESNEETHVKNYTLNITKALYKNLEATEINLSIEYKHTAGGIVLTADAVTFELLRLATLKLL